jgi:hypothetical protein
MATPAANRGGIVTSAAAQNTVTAVNQDLYEASTLQKGPVGSLLETADGRRFRYGYAFAACTANKLCAPDATSQVAAEGAATAVVNSSGGATDYASGITTIYLKDTDKFTSANSANVFQGGFLVHANGGGGPFRIVSNSLTASTSVMKVELEDQTNVAFDSEDEVAIVGQPYNYLQVADSSNMMIAGIPMVTVAAGSYGWFQTRGLCSCLMDGTATDGMLLTLSDGTSGAVQPIGGDVTIDSSDDVTFGAIETEPVVGYAIGATATGKYATIMLQIE